MKTLNSFTPNSLNIQLEGEIFKQGHLIGIQFLLNDPGQIVLDSLEDGSWDKWDRADDLWKTTCFEAFLSAEGEESYWEVNLSPNKKKWNLYHFESYRSPQPPTPSEDFELVEIDVKGDLIKCILQARVELPKSLEANLTTIIRTREGVSYYALKHAPNKPDFHFREALEVLG